MTSPEQFRAVGRSNEWVRGLWLGVLLQMLTDRFGTLPDAIVARVRGASDEQRDVWLDRVRSVVRSGEPAALGDILDVHPADPIRTTAAPTSKFTAFAVEPFPEIQPGEDLADVLTDVLAGTNTALADGDIIVVASRVVPIAQRRCADLSSAREAGHAVDMPELADPEVSAHALRDVLCTYSGASVAVVIADTDGQAARHGTAVISIGAAGIAPLRTTEHAGTWKAETMTDLVANAAGIILGQDGCGTPVAVLRGVNYARLTTA